jgi:hypothetical protein
VCVFSHPNKLEEVTPGTILLLLRDALLLSLVCVAAESVYSAMREREIHITFSSISLWLAAARLGPLLR